MRSNWPMHQFDAGEGNGGAAEPFEPEHHVHPGFEVAVILLNQVIGSGANRGC